MSGTYDGIERFWGRSIVDSFRLEEARVRWISPVINGPVDSLPGPQPYISEIIPLRYIGGRIELTAPISGEPGRPIFWGIDYAADPVPAAAQDHIDTLLDLARTHREQDFRDLALMVGVEREQIDALWDGTVRRLNLSRAQERTGRVTESDVGRPDD